MFGTKAIIGRGIQRCSGAILILAMVFLLLLSVLGGTSMRASIIEYRMSGNQLFKEEAFQGATALASAIYDNEDNFPTDLPASYALCIVGDRSPNCVEGRALSVSPSVLKATEKAQVAYKVERMRPLLIHGMPVRIAQHSVSSSLAFGSAIFEIQTGVGGSTSGLGHARVVQGIAKILAAAPGSSAE